MIVTLIACKVYGINIDIIVVRYEQSGWLDVLLTAFGPVLFQLVVRMGKGAAGAARTYHFGGKVPAHARLVVVRHEAGLLQLPVAVVLHELHQTDHHMLDGLQRSGQLLPRRLRLGGRIDVSQLLQMRRQLVQVGRVVGALQRNHQLLHGLGERLGRLQLIDDALHVRLVARVAVQ